MKMIPYDIAEFKKGGYKKTSNLAILEEFVESEYDCVKIEEYPHKDVYVCSASLKAAIKRFNMTNIECFARNGEVFLIRRDQVD